MQRIGRYEIRGEVARGGAGVVYRAHDPELRRDVAIKVLLASRRDNRVAVERQLREARALARLRHPNVVAVTDVGQLEGAPYLVLEYVPGETLAEHLRRHGPVPPDRAARWTQQLARALAHAHQEGVVHRDVKPANVLLDGGDLAPRLTDFGLAHQQGPHDRSRLSTEGAFMGTPGYWSPEQAAGKLEAVGPATDIWGLGATLYELLTGQPPYQGDTLAAVFSAMQGPPLPPSQLRPGLAPKLEAICLRCLEHDPARRFPSAEALAAALDPLVAPRPRRRPVPAAAWLLGLTLLGLGAGLSLLVERAPPTPIPSSTPVASLAPEPSPPVETPDPDPGASALARARRLFAREDYEAAAAVYAEALARYPDLHIARFELGEALLALDRPQEGATALQRFLEVQPAASRGWFQLGNCYHELRRTEDAVQAWQRTIELEPEFDPAWLNLAAMALGRGQHQLALQRVERALGINPRSARARGMRGAILVELGRYREALPELDVAVEALPDTWTPLEARAHVHFELGALEAALLDATRALELQPDLTQTLLLRAQIFARFEDYDRALTDFERCLALDPDSILAARGRARTLHLLGENEVALLVIEGVVERDPRDAEARALHAIILGWLDRKPEALAEAERALELDPHNLLAGASRVTTLVALGRHEEALGSIDPLLSQARSQNNLRLAEQLSALRDEARARLPDDPR